MFINRHLYRYCGAQQIQFTRALQKSNKTHIEQKKLDQKNWTHVRRYDSPAALQAINDLYRKELRLFQKLFLPGQTATVAAGRLPAAPPLGSAANAPGMAWCR